MTIQYSHTTVGGQDALTNGRYTTQPSAMNRHKSGTPEHREAEAKGLEKSVWRSDVDAESITLQAAEYADQHDLWSDDEGGGGSAKVPVVNIHAGYHGQSGSPLDHITVKRSRPDKNGHSLIHGFPSRTPKP